MRDTVALQFFSPAGTIEGPLSAELAAAGVGSGGGMHSVHLHVEQYIPVPFFFCFVI